MTERAKLESLLYDLHDYYRFLKSLEYSHFLTQETKRKLIHISSELLKVSRDLEEFYSTICDEIERL